MGRTYKSLIPAPSAYYAGFTACSCYLEFSISYGVPTSYSLCGRPADPSAGVVRTNPGVRTGQHIRHLDDSGHNHNPARRRIHREDTDANVASSIDVGTVCSGAALATYKGPCRRHA